jgi:DNA-binding GntR family transcriptional regulator
MRASDRAYRALLAEIVDGTLAPGTVLGEVEQSTRLGVSRTPIREALSRLTADGLVAPQAGRGLIVTEVSLDNISELYEFRGALEEQAARLAAERGEPEAFIALAEGFQRMTGLSEMGAEGIKVYYDLNTQFDEAIDAAIQNSYLAAALRAVRTHLARVRRIAKDNPTRLREAANETLLILEAIIAGDAPLAAHATHVHLHRSLSNIRASAPPYMTENGMTNPRKGTDNEAP